MTRILVLHASSGSGHTTAAQALGRAFEQRPEVKEVRVEDALEHGSNFYRKLYTGFYKELSENAPILWEYAYKLTDKSDKNDTQFVNELRILLDRLGVTELDKFVEEYAPDAVVCTHFLPLHILGRQKQLGRLSPYPLYSAVTDYTGNAKWVCPGVDGYFVATPKVSEMLIDRGVSPETPFFVSGIPVNPTIAEPKDPRECRQKFNLVREPVVTLIGSAIQIDRVREMLVGMLGRDMFGTLVLVAGRSEELLEAMSDLESSPTLDLHKLGFVSEIDDLIVASDLVITKPGGMIVSEILGRHTPMVIVEPIPGQEHWNADYVVGAGAGVQVRVSEMVPFVVQNLLNDTERLHMLAHRASSVGKPQSAMTIVEQVLELTGVREISVVS